MSPAGQTFISSICNKKRRICPTEDLVLIDISSNTAKLEVLCEHNTSWRWQGVHCHPTWSWSNNAILYASDCLQEGYPQLYLVRM